MDYRSGQDKIRLMRAAATRASTGRKNSGRGMKARPITLAGFATAKEGKVKRDMSLFGIGSVVTYVDSTGHDRPALVTNCFGPLESKPSINVVIVNDDENQTDTYGRKIERFTSVVHQSNQWAHGNYWKPISE
jgi:hypothetical protein